LWLPSKVLDSISATDDPEWRTFAARQRAAVALIHGQVAQAERELAQNATGDPDSRQALLDSVTLASIDAWFFGDDERAARRIDHALARDPLRDVLLLDRPYFEIATAYARAARPDKAQAMIAAYHADVADTALRRLQQSQLHNALGEIALAQNKPRDAIAEFQRGDVAYDGQPATEYAPCVEFNLARAFDAAGMADSAIAAYERFIKTPYFNRIEETDPFGLAGAHKRLGELYEAKGDRQGAVSHFQQFLTSWKNADPALQPRVAEVKRRLERMADGEKP
jgi:tetratricopeptide (TPR) repeat protein